MIKLKPFAYFDTGNSQSGISVESRCCPLLSPPCIRSYFNQFNIFPETMKARKKESKKERKKAKKKERKKERKKKKKERRQEMAHKNNETMLSGL